MDTKVTMGKDTMNKFLADISARRNQRAQTEYYKNTESYKVATIKEKQDQATRTAAQEVFCNIYRGALPLDTNHKSAYKASLDGHVKAFISKETDGKTDVYDYLKGIANKGSVPAQKLCAGVENGIAAAYLPYYEDAVDPEKEMNVDEIDTSEKSDIVAGVIDKVSNDMSSEEISSVIENSVKETIAHEMEVAKQEDEKVAELEQQLAENENIVTEEAVEMAIMEAGYDPSSVYQPGLFTAIMTGNVTRLNRETPPTTPEIATNTQKKAFYESVKEYTVLETLNAFNAIPFNSMDRDRLANKYAMA